MSRFNPCQGKTACRDNGAVCLTCGRSLAEIEATRQFIDDLAELVMGLDYENVEEFAEYVGQKVVKKVAYRRQEQQA